MDSSTQMPGNVVKRMKRWSLEEKKRIVAETRNAGASSPKVHALTRLPFARFFFVFYVELQSFSTEPRYSWLYQGCRPFRSAALNRRKTAAGSG
jgi:hypothetical protein